MKKFKVGVFDSGVGGLSVANAIQAALPQMQVIFRNDNQNMPYGDKPRAQVLELVTPILKQLASEGCDIIVIACNTVTTNHLPELKHRINLPLIGVEPQVKTAAGVTKSGVVAVCATPGTLASQRYLQLKHMYAKDIKVIEPDCSRWAYMIEHGEVEERAIARQINEVCSTGADAIVLGCTHYHWIEGLIKRTAQGRAAVIQPEQKVVEQVKRILGL